MWKMYDEVIHVPLAIHAPELVEGREFDGIRGLMDVPATILASLGLPKPAAFLGRSLLTAANEPSAFRQYVISEVGHSEETVFDIGWRWFRYSIRGRRWKLLYRPFTGDVELYDLRHDPKERHNLAREELDVVEGLMGLLRRHIRAELASIVRARVKRALKRLKSP